ncbi:type I polyketide synthase [Halomonas halocynthiae]|uniref:type I polyketide synthase n=1 Tax=Halomonas halocynthiae TaxID=176290 RepID=UPI00042A2A74|nr:type I polyketide synthase [Halomonas halocynthiae]
MTKRVAIIGASHRFPGTTTDTFWQDLKAGKDLVTQVAEDRWSQEAYQHPDRQHPGTSVTFAAGSVGDISGFDADFFGISPREATHLDPQQRMLLELAWEAIEDARMAPSSLRGSRCSVFIGISTTDHAFRLADDLAALGTTTATGNTTSIAANRISYLFDLRGPSMAVDTACSSSLVAFHQACQTIRSGESEMALAGGISLHMHPYGFIVFSKASMLSANGRCRVFDADGDGYVRSEGAGIFLLKDYDKAVADGDPILAVVAGSRVNTDGYKSGLTVPSIDAQATLMRETYTQAGIDPNDIDYLEAHGTGTAVGDPIETRAIGEALAMQRATPLPIGSVKSNLGHLETASGAAGLSKALYSLRYREVPATIGIRTLNPNIKFDEWNLEVVTQAQPLKREGRLIIGVNSFGFGGANAHVILESPPEAEEAPATAENQHPRPLPLQLSARSEPALRAAAGRLADWLKRSDDSLYDIAYTLSHHREQHRDGALLMVSDRQDAIAKLAALADSDAAPDPQTLRGERLAEASAPAFIYAGNGCQWDTMGAELLASSAVFAAAIDEVDALYQQHGDYSLRAELEGRNGTLEDGSSRLTLTEIAQPALFAVQVGLTRLLATHGIAPAAVAGHSVGEVAAAWASGALSLANAVKVIHYRSYFQGKTRGQGEMSAASISAEDIQPWLNSGDYPDVYLAGINSPGGITLAGNAEALGHLEVALSQQGIVAKRLPLDYAFHSPAMDAIQADITTTLADIAPQPGQITYISTVTGAELPTSKLDADYWWQNIRQPVRFNDAVNTLIDTGSNVFIEIGAHPILRRYLNDALRDREQPGKVIATLQRKRPAEKCLNETVGQTLLSGAAYNQNSAFPVAGRRVALPHYCWQHEHFWISGTSSGLRLLERYYEHPLLGYRLAQQHNTWESQLDTGRLPWLADHVVGESAVFPGAGFVELALAAAHHGGDNPLIDIEALEIRAPLLLDSPKGRNMRLHLAGDDGRIEIHSREPLAEGEWQLNAVARVTTQSRGFLLRRKAPAVPQRKPDITREQHLELAARLGLNYGPAFQAISRTWITDDGVIGEITLPEAIEQQCDDLYLHPGILDSAFQLFIPLLAHEASAHGTGGNALEDRGLAFVPVQVGRVQLLANRGKPALAHATILKRAPHSFTADFALYDAQGRATAVLHETRFRAIRLKRQHHQQFSYLDVQLTPAPRLNSIQALDPAPLKTAVAELAADFSAPSAIRFANEVDPLLDSLADAFAADALSGLNDNSGHLSHARYRELTRQQPEAQRLLDQLIQQLQDAERLVADNNGWQLHSTEDDIPAASIWQLLVRDYPDHFAPVHKLGRLGRHLPALLAGHDNAESLGFSTDSLATLCRQLPGTDSWHRLAGTLQEVLSHVLNQLPTGQRLRLLEAGPATPALSEQLYSLQHADRCDFGLLSVGDSAKHQAEQLQERLPLIDLEVLGSDDAPLPPAQLALISLETSHVERTCRLLRALPQRLAPGAQLLLIGTHPSAWLDALLATPGLHDDQHSGAGTPLLATSPSAVVDELKRLGASNIEQLSLGDAGRGLYLLQASWPEVTEAAQAEIAADAETKAGTATTPLQILVDEPSRALGERLISALSARGGSAVLCSELDDNSTPLTCVDLRQGDARCDQAMALAHHLEPLGSEASLWLITRDVAAMWADASPVAGAALAQPQGAQVPMDAALWGFGRSLANESSGYTVRLLDLSSGQPDTALSDVQINALADELSTPDAETEIVLDAQGQRFVTRLRTLPAPSSTAIRRADTPEQSMRLGFELPGQLRNLAWTAHPLPKPGPGEVTVRVKATGLNFRDVMYTLGLLSDEAIENGFAGPTLGLEFSGVIEALGDDASGLSVGDAVVGFGPASFSDRLIASHLAIAPLPTGHSFAAAATLPTAFFTVYYALKYLARLAPGERVLIHGAAGGVGIAAIQVAQWLGAEIHASVGSDDKRDFLHLMGVTHIYDSRALTFAEEVLDATDGRGVDVVLNSLAGEAIHQNLRALRPFGRFLELGKRDFYANTQVGLRPFRNNLSYFGIDSDQLMKELPELTSELFSELMGLFADGSLTPLPYTAFSSQQVVDAFRYMQQARQIGKIVVTHDQPLQPAEPHTLGRDILTLPDTGSYLITGGLSGFGLKTAQWLASRGARQLILVGRSGAASDAAKAAVAELEAQGVQVIAAACDITDCQALSTLLDDCRTRLSPLRGIVHAATVIDDGLIRNLNAERIARVLAPKIDGARHLDALTRNDQLDFFVLYSSATTLFGNPGQASYVAANHWLEALAAARRAQGLPASCLRWGAIDDVGFLARNTRTRDALQERLGGSALHSDDALRVLEQLLIHYAGHGSTGSARAGSSEPTLGVLELEWSALRRSLPNAEAPRFNEISRQADDEHHSHDDGGDISALLAGLSPKEQHSTLCELLRAELAAILLADEDRIDVNRSIYDMGFDSLMGVELMTAIESRLGVQVPVMVLSEASTINKLANVLLTRMDQAKPDANNSDAELASLAARHGAESYDVPGSESTQ